MSNIQAQIDALAVSIQVLDNTLSNVTGNTLSNYNQLSRIVAQQGNIYNTVYFGLGNLSTGNLNFTGNLFQNGMPYFAGQWTTLNGNIYYSSGNVGIKNSTPNFELDVYGNINLSGNLFQNGSPYVASQWTTLNGNIYYTSGNVGIKKTTPEFDLDVNGDINLSGNLFQNGSPYIGSQWTTSGSNIYYNIVNGNVGIGTTTPYYALDIGGSANVGANVYCMNMFVINDCLVQGGDFSIMNGNLTVYKRFNTFGESVLNGNLTVYNADFYNYGNSYIYNGLYLNKNGALYTNNDVAGQHAFYSFDTVNLMSTLYGGADDTNKVGYFQARGYGGGLPLLLNPNGGNVGIGIGNPTATLDIKGSGNISGNISIGGNLIINSDSNISNALTIRTGFKGDVATSKFITYDIPFTGTHYFGDNVEATGNIISGRGLQLGNTISNLTSPFTIVTGTLTIGNISANTSVGPFTLTYGFTFSSAPTVTGTARSGTFAEAVSMFITPSTTTAIVWCRNCSTGAASNVIIQWTAIGFV